MSELPTVLLHGLDTLRPDVEAVLDGYRVVTRRDGVRARCLVTEPSALELPSPPSGQPHPPVVLVADEAGRAQGRGRNRVEEVVGPVELHRKLAPAVSKAVIRDVLRYQVFRARADRTLPQAVRTAVLHLLQSDRKVSIGRVAVETELSRRTLRRQWAAWRGTPSGEPHFSDVASSILALHIALRRLDPGGPWARGRWPRHDSRHTARVMMRSSGRQPSQLRPQDLAGMAVRIEAWLEELLYEPLRAGEEPRGSALDQKGLGRKLRSLAASSD